jgi:hypothetical protein
MALVRPKGGSPAGTADVWRMARRRDERGEASEVHATTEGSLTMPPWSYLKLEATARDDC